MVAGKTAYRVFHRYDASCLVVVCFKECRVNLEAKSKRGFRVRDIDGQSFAR